MSQQDRASDDGRPDDDDCYGYLKPRFGEQFHWSPLFSGSRPSLPLDRPTKSVVQDTVGAFDLEHNPCLFGAFAA